MAQGLVMEGINICWSYIHLSLESEKEVFHLGNHAKLRLLKALNIASFSWLGGRTLFRIVCRSVLAR